MNKLRIFFALALAGSVLAGCRSNIDFENVDGQAAVNVGVVLPVGSITFTIKDLLPTNADIYFDSLGKSGPDEIDRGVLVLKAHKVMDRYYHQIDLSQYISTGKFNLPIHDELSASSIVGTGTTVTLNFPMELTLDGINKDNTWERLDSAMIDSARFTSAIGVKNFPDLKWEYIEGIDLKLGDRFHCKNSNIVPVYKKGDAASGFGDEIPIDLKDFVLCMMKNPHLNPASDFYAYRDNVYDTCLFHIAFKVNVPVGKTVNIPADAAFTYDLSVQFIDYTAIWGLYEATDQMRDEDTIEIADQLFGPSSILTDANLPFADPRINVNIVTSVAGALILTADYLFVEDVNGVQHDAEFNGLKYYEKSWIRGEYLDPYTSQIGDTTTNMKLRFDKDKAFGRIDRLFMTTPDLLAYKWHIKFNFQETPQIRITNNTNIRMEADAVLPMVFNEGVKVEAKDTITDIDLSQANIDSLLNDVNVVDTLKATDLKLYLTAESTIPLRVKGLFRPLDKNGNEIMVEDENGNLKPMQLFEKDTITIEPPKMTYTNAIWVPTPTKQAILASVDKKMLDQLPNIKSIEYSLWVDDESLDYAYKQGNFNVKITEDAAIKLHIGVTAYVDAILNLNNSGDNKQ